MREGAKKDIRKVGEAELQEAFLAMQEPKFRAAQVMQWIWQKGAISFDAMSNLPQGLREKLKLQYDFYPIKADVVQKSQDGTIKVGFRLHDGFMVEGVLIPTETRMTACVSSQVGCSLDCKFCATGYLKRERNLEAAEIVDQVRLLDEMARSHYGQGLTNVVYMGMGEPLLNYAHVMESVHRLTHEIGMGMSASRITVSTAGIAKMIHKMADEGARFNLALSLHAANNEKRSAIMPINDSNTLEMLADALKNWYDKTGNRPTLEYAVIEGVNDEREELEDLVKFAKKFPCKVNLIEYNPIAQAGYLPTSSSKMERFAAGLEASGIIAVVRRSRGKDIDAACGQLANKQ